MSREKCFSDPGELLWARFLHFGCPFLWVRKAWYTLNVSRLRKSKDGRITCRALKSVRCHTSNKNGDWSINWGFGAHNSSISRVKIHALQQMCVCVCSYPFSFCIISRCSIHAVPFQQFATMYAIYSRQVHIQPCHTLLGKESRRCWYRPQDQRYESHESHEAKELQNTKKGCKALCQCKPWASQWSQKSWPLVTKSKGKVRQYLVGSQRRKVDLPWLSRHDKPVEEQAARKLLRAARIGHAYEPVASSCF